MFDISAYGEPEEEPTNAEIMAAIAGTNERLDELIASVKAVGDMASDFMETSPFGGLLKGLMK